MARRRPRRPRLLPQLRGRGLRPRRRARRASTDPARADEDRHLAHAPRGMGPRYGGPEGCGEGPPRVREAPDQASTLRPESSQKTTKSSSRPETHRRDFPTIPTESGAGVAVGIEVTEAIPSNLAHAVAVQNKHYPDAALDASLFAWDAPTLTSEEIHEVLRKQGPRGAGWAGDAAERQWASHRGGHPPQDCEAQRADVPPPGSELARSVRQRTATGLGSLRRAPSSARSTRGDGERYRELRPHLHRALFRDGARCGYRGCRVEAPSSVSSTPEMQAGDEDSNLLTRDACDCSAGRTQRSPVMPRAPSGGTPRSTPRLAARASAAGRRQSARSAATGRAGRWRRSVRRPSCRSARR